VVLLHEDFHMAVAGLRRWQVLRQGMQGPWLRYGCRWQLPLLCRHYGRRGDSADHPRLSSSHSLSSGTLPSRVPRGATRQAASIMTQHGRLIACSTPAGSQLANSASTRTHMLAFRSLHEPVPDSNLYLDNRPHSKRIAGASPAQSPDCCRCRRPPRRAPGAP